MASPLENVLAKFPDAKLKPNGEYEVLCPTHADNKPSLHIKQGDNGGALIKCRAGCDTATVLAAVGLTLADAMPPKDKFLSGEKWEEVPNSFQFVCAYDYTTATGDLVYQVVRFNVQLKNSLTGKTKTDKTFRQRRPDGQGGYIKNLAGVTRIPYHLPAIIAASKSEPVYWCEGEKDADNLSAMGVLTTTTAQGAAGFKPAYEYAAHFAGRHVVVLPDNDKANVKGERAGIKYAQTVAAALAGVAASVRIIELPNRPENGGDVSDWIRAGGSSDALHKLAKAAPIWQASKISKSSAPDTDEGEEGRGPSVATRLVQIARERFTLWHTMERKPYATVPTADGHTETWEVESTGFRHRLQHVYFAESGRAIAPAAMQSAVSTISMLACVEGQEKIVYTRKADLSETTGTIYLDLSNDKWQAVEITAAGWKVVDNPPVAFRRTRGMLSLPVPEPGGRLSDLRQFVNMPAEGDGGDILIFAWLLAALGPHYSYPILHLMGEQGTAKSWAGRFLRALVDPASPDLRREPKEDRDLAIAGTNAFVVAFDNVSSFPLWLSDTLCTIATGGGFGTRKLHSDDGEALFAFKCPVLMTGIGEPSTKGDFLQRSLLVSLPVISEEGRKGEADVKPAFDAARPKLLGALFDAVSCGLRNFAKTRLAASPRMADFARWVSACEPACPWEPGAFMDAYGENQAAGGDAALDADKIAPLIIRLVEQNTETPGRWEGTAVKLMETLETMMTDKDKIGLPKNARSLSVAVKRIAPALRAQRNIDWVQLPKDSRGVRPLRFQKLEIATEQNTGQNSKSTGQNYGAKLGEAFDSQPIDDKTSGFTGQTGQTGQNFPISTSADKKRKIVEETESITGKEAELQQEYNAPEFAPFAPLPRGSLPNDKLAGVFHCVKAAYHGTGADIRAVRGRIVYVEKGEVTGFWIGPANGKAAMGSDPWEAVEPFPAPASEVHDALDDPFAE